MSGTRGQTVPDDGRRRPAAHGGARPAAAAGDTLGPAPDNDGDMPANMVMRRLHAFSRRLSRTFEPAAVRALVLRTMARAAGARTGSLATFEADDTLAISETYGYPREIVEHIRIAPGEGIIGRAFENEESTLVRGLRESEEPRDASATAPTPNMVLPIVAGTSSPGRRHPHRHQGRPLRRATFMREGFSPPVRAALWRWPCSGETQRNAHRAYPDRNRGLSNRRVQSPLFRRNDSKHEMQQR